MGEVNIYSLELVKLADNVIASEVVDTSQTAKFILLNNSANTIYLTKGDFEQITTETSYFRLLGNPVIKVSDQKYSVELKDGDSQELTIDSKLVQNKGQAEALAGMISKYFFHKRSSFEVEIFGNPFIQIGDVVNFIYYYGKINTNNQSKKYLVVGITHNFDKGLTTTITIRPLEKI